MCVVSMVMEHYWDRWNTNPLSQPQSVPNLGTFINRPNPVFPSPEEIADFYRLLARAREYDKKNNEPDCELQEKKDKLLNLAKDLGVEINFGAGDP